MSGRTKGSRGLAVLYEGSQFERGGVHPHHVVDEPLMLANLHALCRHWNADNAVSSIETFDAWVYFWKQHSFQGSCWVIPPNSRVSLYRVPDSENTTLGNISLGDKARSIIVTRTALKPMIYGRVYQLESNVVVSV